jgi:lactate dehydrogenase-like 2-hydroxyacid dehydrogenase
MSRIAITDFITDPVIEREILGDLVSANVDNETEVLLVWHEKIDGEYIGKLPKLKAVQRYGVGYDTIDIDALGKLGIIVCNNPDYGTDEVSDTAIAMILNIARGMAIYNEASKKYSATWQINYNPRVKRNSETTVGIIGAGRIGGSVILRCNALKFKVVFYDKYKERGYEKLVSANRLESMDEVLENSDIVSLHVPLTKETKGMVDRVFISRMKQGSSLVNTARGGLFSDLDIISEALETGKLYQFATDVLPDEPPLSGRLIDSWRRSEEWLNGRVIINPHTAWYSNESIIEMRVRAAQNALRLLHGQPAHNRII